MASKQFIDGQVVPLRPHEVCIDVERTASELDLDLMAGELVCFMGPNGIGKSTLIRTLAGLQKPLSGVISTEKKIAIVLTDRIHAYNMTVRDLVTFGRYPYLNWNIKLNEKDTLYA